MCKTLIFVGFVTSRGIRALNVVHIYRCVVHRAPAPYAFPTKRSKKSIYQLIKKKSTEKTHVKRHVPLPGNMAVIVVTEMGRMVGNYQTEK